MWKKFGSGGKKIALAPPGAPAAGVDGVVVFGKSFPPKRRRTGGNRPKLANHRKLLKIIKLVPEIPKVRWAVDGDSEPARDGCRFPLQLLRILRKVTKRTDRSPQLCDPQVERRPAEGGCLSLPAFL